MTEGTQQPEPDGATVLRDAIPEVEADPTQQPAQAATVAVYFNQGTLDAIAQYPLGGGSVLHLTAASKMFDQLGDAWHMDGVQLEDGPGGVVRVGNVDLEVGPGDVILCYALDERLQPSYDVAIGKAPRPVHLWAAGQLLRALANFTVSKAIANLEMQQMADAQARQKLLSLPHGVRDQIRG